MLRHLPYEEDARILRSLAEEMRGLAAPDKAELAEAIRDEVLHYVDRLEEEVAELREDIRLRTNPRWEDPHP